jgi:WD domain, G-beta repeat
MTQMFNFVGHQQLVNDVKFSPDARYIASASFDKSLRLWDGRTGKFLAVFRGHVQVGMYFATLYFESDLQPKSYPLVFMFRSLGTPKFMGAKVTQLSVLFRQPHKRSLTNRAQSIFPLVKW